MDSSHKLDAPSNDELKNIEQIADHSDLSTLYNKAKGFEGELISDQERQHRQETKYDTIAFGIRKKFLLVGFLIPLPIILATVILAVFLPSVDKDNVTMLAVPAIFLFIFWAVISFVSVKKVFKLFYSNALQAGPFYVALLSLLTISAYIIYNLTIPIHNYSPFMSTLLVSGIAVVWSVVLAFFLLRIWTTPAINGNYKILLLGGIFTGLAAWAGWLFWT